METVTYEGITAQVDALAQAEAEGKAWGENDIIVRANRIAEAAKRRVHVSPGAGTDGVHLRDGIGVGKLKRRAKYDSYVEVGAIRTVLTLPDGRATFEEYGTRKQQAYPFLRPSVEEEFA